MLAVLDLSSSFTDMLLHSVALRTQSSDQAQIADSTQVGALFSTLEAGKRFLDALLSFPVHDYHLISFSEWMRLPTVIMTVARLCMPTEAHTASGWDVKAAQDRIRLDLCLESLCYRMQSLSTYDKKKQPHPDFWYAMRFINDLTKTWFMRKTKPDGPASTQATPSSQAGPVAIERSDPSSGTFTTSSTHRTAEPYTTPAGTNYMGNFSTEMQVEIDDFNGPFASFKNADFDMEQFLDMGIWGDESYHGMGFGGGMPF